MEKKKKQRELKEKRKILDAKNGIKSCLCVNMRVDPLRGGCLRHFFSVVRGRRGEKEGDEEAINREKLILRRIGHIFIKKRSSKTFVYLDCNSP